MRMKNSLDKRTKWCYCIGATGRDAAYALVSMYLLTYVQYTMKLTVAQFGVISAAIVVCLIWDAVNDALMGIIIENTAAAGLGLCRLFCHRVSSLGHDLHHERHRLLGNAPQPEQRPQRAGHTGDADERIHLRRPVRGGGDRAHGGGGKRDSGVPGDGDDRRAGVYRVPDFSGSGGSGRTISWCPSALRPCCSISGTDC